MIPGADQNKTGSWIKDNGREYVPSVTEPATSEARTWEGWGTCLKPAFEPIVVGRKPLVGTVVSNVLQYGTGGLNVDGCRVEGETTGRGRWPTNVALDDSQAASLDAQTGDLKAGGAIAKGSKGAGPRGNNDAIYGLDASARGEWEPYGDSGGASRFYPTFHYASKAPQNERPVVDGVVHPTVKPLDLMRWLVRLVTPSAGVVLDPFAGSGTTIEACVLEGFRCIAIEREADYLPLITQRLNKATQLGLDL
jgi:site-specific DNA-methyltransferase (adenine-specific)